MMLGKLDSYMKKIKWDYFLIPYIKINAKWTEDLNVRPETIKLLEESIGSMLSDIILSNIFLDMSPQARETKEKTMGLYQIKSFCTAKETINKTKRLPTEREKIFANYISDKELITKMYKELTQLNIKKKLAEMGFPGGAVVESLPANAGDTGSSPGLGRSHMPRSSWAREPQLLSLHV